jgi:hypothetical protein
MGLIQFVRHFLLWLKYRKAAIVNSRDELDTALQRMPPRIVVEGDEALRAHAAMLVERNAEKLAELEAASPAPGPGEPPVYMVVPTVGRIRDGYRPTRKRAATGRPISLRNGLDSVVVATIGIVAALMMEWLSYPDEAPRMVRGPRRPGMRLTVMAAPQSHLSKLLLEIAVPLLGLIAVAAAGWLIWQALALGSPVKTGWRLEQRVPGRLVMVRTRTRRK